MARRATARRCPCAGTVCALGRFVLSTTPAPEPAFLALASSRTPNGDWSWRVLLRSGENRRPGNPSSRGTEWGQPWREPCRSASGRSRPSHVHPHRDPATPVSGGRPGGGDGDRETEGGTWMKRKFVVGTRRASPTRVAAATRPRSWERGEGRGPS